MSGVIDVYTTHIKIVLISPHYDKIVHLFVNKNMLELKRRYPHHNIITLTKICQGRFVMIRLSAFADEADSTLSGQIEALRRNGVGYVELRGINGTGIAKITEEDAREYKKQLDEGGIAVWSIGSPIGKIKITDDLDAHMELLRHICRLANVFDTDKVRMFSFYEAYNKEELVFSTLKRMVAIADEYGVKLYHENEKEIYGDTAERVLRIIENVKGLGFIYDPANFIESGEHPSVTLDPLFSHMGYFHIKDAMWEGKAIVPAGHGDGEIPRLVSMIGDKDTVLSVEPHLMVFEGYSEFDSTKMQNKYVFASNGEAFDAAITAIKSVITSCGYNEVNGGFRK